KAQQVVTASRRKFLRELPDELLPLGRAKDMKEAGVGNGIEWTWNRRQCKGVGHPKLHHPSNVCGTLRRFLFRLLNRSDRQIDTYNREPSFRESEDQISGAAADIEHGTRGWMFVQKRHELRLRVADIPRSALAIRRIEELRGWTGIGGGHDCGSYFACSARDEKRIAATVHSNLTEAPKKSVLFHHL